MLMTKHRLDFELKRPRHIDRRATGRPWLRSGKVTGPGVFGGSGLGSVMRVDLFGKLVDRFGHLVDVAAAAFSQHAIVLWAAYVVDRVAVWAGD